MRLLLINPNASAHITARLAASARAALAPGDTLTALTAADGPPVVRDAASLALAERAALRLARAHGPAHDALVLGLSLDGVVDHLAAAVAPRPAVGMTAAALDAAAAGGRAVGLLTLGPAMLPLYRTRVAALGMSAAVVAWEAPDLPAAFRAGPQDADEAVLGPLAQACGRLQAAGARAVVLAGAVLCGLDAVLQARSGLPVYDGVRCAVERICKQLSAGPVAGGAGD